MRAVVQRVSCASVSVGGRVTGKIAAGVLILLAVGRNDESAAAAAFAEKIANLRIFEDADGKMNRALLETGGAALAVSQFTLVWRRPARPASGLRSGRASRNRECHL